ncbi:hypothetical protein MVEG_02332 [Podila verticillata NRRL 6337]|nr:hypothetical protein MVEG_02332 [Podila verticillata NRRL 6337]
MKRDDYEGGSYCHTTHNRSSIPRTSSPPSPLTDRTTSCSFRAAWRGIHGNISLSRVTHLTLLEYVLVMGEWLHLMQLVPALQHLDIHITSISLSDHPSSPLGGTTLHQDLTQDQAAEEMDEMATGISHITLYRASRSSASVESRSKGNDINKDENEKRCHDDTLVDTGIANHDHCPDTFVPGYVSFADLGQSRCRHSRDRNQEQDHVVDEGKSEGKSRHDVDKAMEMDEAIGNGNLGQQQQRQSQHVSHLQFTSVRSLVFRGKVVSAEMLAYLPRLESLSFAPVPAILADTSPLASPLSFSQSTLGPVDLADTLMNQCPWVTRLALNEPSIITSGTGDAGWARHLTLLMYSMPRLEHFMTSIQIMSTLGSEIVSALLEHLSQSLKSFRVIASQPVFFAAHRHQQQRSGLKRKLSDTSFESTSEDDYISNNHTPSRSIEGTVRQGKQECLRILESCPRLETFECQMNLSLQDVIASVPKWPCHNSIKVLAFEIQELFCDCSVEEVAIMDMFIKTMLHVSHTSSPTEEINGKQPSIGESDPLSYPSTSYPIPSISSTDTFVSKSSALDPTASGAPSTSSSLSVPKKSHEMHTMSPLYATPIVATSITTSPPSETLPSAYFPRHRHAKVSRTTCDTDMEASDKEEAPRVQQQDPPALSPTLSERRRTKYPVHAVSRLVALQYLVEQQLVKMSSLDRFCLGRTMYSMPKT